MENRFRENNRNVFSYKRQQAYKILHCCQTNFNVKETRRPGKGSRWSRASRMLKFKDISIDAESKSAKIPKSLYGGGGGGGGGGWMTANFQLLMLSPNLLKSQSPFMVVGGGGVCDGQLPTFDAESKSAKIPKSLYGGGGGCVMANFQLLMLSPNLLKSKNPFTVGGGLGGVKIQLPIFDAESKSAKI